MKTRIKMLVIHYRRPLTHAVKPADIYITKPNFLINP